MAAWSPYCPIRPPRGDLAFAVVFVKKLWPPQGRPKATLRHYLKRQIFCLHKFKIRRAATLEYVTATVCDRGNAAAVL